MVATSVAGLLLASYSQMSLLYLAIALAVPGMIISFLSRKTLDESVEVG
jgi:hypothetical protein